MNHILQKLVEGLDVIKDDMDKDNLAFQYTDSSKDVSSIVQHLLNMK